MINTTYGPPTHYQTLGVSEMATQEEIKHAYRRLAKKYHPDHNRKQGAEAKFKEINEAYQVLGDPGRRQIYDYDLAQSRRPGTSSAGTSAPPPPPSPPPQPSPQRAYRYLFFFRGALVGGGAVALGVVLVLSAYAGCRRSSAEPASSVPAPETIPGRSPYGPSAPAPTEPEPMPPTPEPSPTALKPTATREPTVTPAPTATPEPTPSAPDPTPALAPVHLCGKWHGTFDWLGTEIRFKMTLEQNGDEVSGTWTETNSRRIWRATIAGRVTGSTLTLTKTYKETGMTVSVISTESSPKSLRGTWETPQSRGSWEAEREGGLAANAESNNHDDSWRERPRPQPRVRDEEPCWYGWRRTPDGSYARCAASPRRSSSP